MQGALKLTDEEFFTAPLKTRKATLDPLLGAGVEALIADAPRKVSIDVRDTLPMVVVRAGSFGAVASAPVSRAGIVVATDLETGQVRAEMAVQPPEKSVQPDEPREAPEGAMAGETKVVDLRKRLDLPWRPSRYAVALILREQISDPLEVLLDSSPGGYKDPEVEKHRKAALGKAPLPAVHPAPDQTVRYRNVAGAPELSAAGLALSAPRVRKASEKGPLLLTGSFRVEVPAHLVVKKSEHTKALEAQLGEAGLPSALVPITFVITGSKIPQPEIWHTVLPAWGAIDPKKPVAAGSFAIDLNAAANFSEPLQTLFVYAFCGAHRFGPLPIAIVDEEQ